MQLNFKSNTLKIENNNRKRADKPLKRAVKLCQVPDQAIIMSIYYDNSPILNSRSERIL